MPGMTHDLFVRHTVAIGSCDEPGTQAVRAERFCKRASQSGLGSTLQKDLAHCVGAQSGAFDHASPVDLPEQRAPVISASPNLFCGAETLVGGARGRLAVGPSARQSRPEQGPAPRAIAANIGKGRPRAIDHRPSRGCLDLERCRMPLDGGGLRIPQQAPGAPEPDVVSL